MDDKIYSIALSLISSPGSYNLWELIDEQQPEELYKMISDFGDVKTQGFIAKEYSLDPVETAKRIIERAESKEINILDYWSKDYPSLLKEIHKSPVVLYAKGKLNLNKTIAIVGTRNSDYKSSNISNRLASELSSAGYTIISGMAIGVDREAHLGALENNGTTIGILANGIDIQYPAANSDIYKEILDSGKSSIVSEYPPGIIAGKWTFVRRNRIISGMSRGAVIVKAGERSGALITARYALEQDRDVFVCPGLAFDKSYGGNHRLLKNGAIPVSETKDIIESLEEFKFSKVNNRLIEKQLSFFEGDNGKNLIPKKIDKNINDQNLENEKKPFPELDLLEEKILTHINSDSEIDKIVRETGLSPGEVNEAVVSLELSGIILRCGNFLSRI